ncbi:VOC family protein [Burkholderia sp. TSV86]|uniref:VOC family protein n=1 Tax=Burkholderia sp. TSV86 TaxID=1385594 RepID=UPI0007575AB1|nr:VOC family protein [Burkholderia sp. TSV86]KVE39255.1 glyoxalase [Burkholderia sp. TSV86]
MAAHPLTLDHLVVAARTLDEGTRYVADTLGIEPAGGGAHASMRTHNRLFGLWGGAYLEVIAPDPDAPPPAAGEAPRPRLFGLDDPGTRARLEHGPYLAHWVARVERPCELGRWQRQYPARIARVVPMSRGDFHWRLTVPDDGALPAWQHAGDGVLPSLIQWQDARHPSDTLPHGGIALKKLNGVHPRAHALREQLAWLRAAHLIDIDACDTPALVAEFETPAGMRTLR